MAQLKNRQLSIPNGIHFYQPETNWSSPPRVSFDQVVQALIAHRSGHPYLIQKNGWAMDYESVANEVDDYNTRVCQKMGWLDYIIGEGAGESPPPKGTPLQQVNPWRASAVVAGAETLVDWITSGAEAVPAELANGRATICTLCLHNQAGDWLSLFTRPASEAIRKTLNLRDGLKLATPLDDQLGVCNVCACPLKLKIHLALPRIRARLSAEIQSQLPPYCWIVKESAA